MSLAGAIEAGASYADGKLLAGTSEGIGVVLFNHPERRNALTLEMWDGLCQALDLFSTDEDVRVVVYAGTGGKAFSAGNDISQFAARRHDAESSADYARITARGAEKLAAFGKPSIACIQGYCMGGGLGLALQADLRVASADAVFGVPAARLGIGYGLAPTERLVSLVGPARARLMLYTARKFTASEAFAMGLVDVLATADAGSAAMEVARTIADNAPLSVRTAKFAIEQLAKSPSERDVAGVAEHVRRCSESADFREGRTAFMEKRRPVFVGA